MVAQRRFAPLITIVFIGLALIIVRLFQVQVVEHEVWAQQAAGLVRSSRVLPSHRGSILDVHGRVLVRDEDVYQIDLRYRDFRRRHPLGVLTHAYSSLEMRPVRIRDAYDHRAVWTAALLRVSPAQLDSFEKGAGLVVGEVRVPATERPGLELCARRAADLRYYLAQLLELSREEQALLRRLEGSARESSYLECIAKSRKWSADALVDRVARNMEDACAALAELAPALQSDSRDENATAAHAGATPIAGLITVLEEARANIEDESADELFETAAGFDAGAIRTESLATVFDVDWIGRLLRWDAPRLGAWIASRADLYRARVEKVLLPRALVHVELEVPQRRAERLLDELAFLYAPVRERDEDGRPPSWRDLDRIAVLDQLDTLFSTTRLPSGVSVPDVVLPFQDDELRTLAPESANPWKIVGLVSDLSGKSESEFEEPLREEAARASWAQWGRDRAGLEGEDTFAELVRLERALSRRHRNACDRLLAALLASARHANDHIERLSITDGRKKRAEARDRFVQVDRGNRTMRLLDTPDYELVQRIARYPARFRGFEVREATKRVPLVRDPDGEPCAGLLIGSVSKPYLRDMLKQAGDARRLSELRFMVMRSAAEERELLDLVARVQRSDQWAGAWGLEDYLDPELRGRPGWLQTEGLEERARNDSGAVVQAPRDGQDVTLTIDADLQLAAQQVISHPVPPRDDHTDVAWFENPVGAIVLLSAEGDVLAAASAPVENHLASIPGRDRERTIRRERTLQLPTFNPPGSVFKPFIAAYALDRLAFDPNHRFECRDLGKGKGGFETMRCTSIHGDSDLAEALAVSCNSYFAQLGLVYDIDHALEMTRIFGFTEPTGIMNLGAQKRHGLREEVLTATELRANMNARTDYMRFGNGLSVLSVVPMQVARATVALATGRMPDVRIVNAISGQTVPQRAHTLEISESNLARVRAAMRQVVEGSRGSAHGKGLDERSLGFSFACKTGSADYAAFRDSPELIPADQEARRLGKLRKHTWITGWFPAETPRAIVVVYLHDTSETSSHTAVYVAAQFLQTEAVKRFMAPPAAGSAK